MPDEASLLRWNHQELQKFIDSQGFILPIQFDWAGVSHVYLSPKSVVPVMYHQSTEPKGKGAWGEVFEVEIPTSFQSNLKEPQKSFLLKRFSGKPAAPVPSGGKIEIPNLRHSNLLQHLFSGTQMQETYIMFPMPTTYLSTVLDLQPPPMSYEIIKQLLYNFHGIASAIQYLHEKAPSQVKIYRGRNPRTALTGYYLDIRPENVLIFSNSLLTEQVWRIGDFGVESQQRLISYQSAETHPSMSQSVGSRKSTDVDLARKSDIWSFGCLLLMYLLWLLSFEQSRDIKRLLSQESPTTNTFWFRPTSGKSIELRPMIEDALDSLQEKTSATMLEPVLLIVRSMLATDVRSRPTSAEIQRQLNEALFGFRRQNELERPSSVAGLEFESQYLFSDSASASTDEEIRIHSSSEHDYSRPSTPETMYSDDRGGEDKNRSVMRDFIESDGEFSWPGQLGFDWQQQAIYPLLVRGIEPAPIVDSIQTTLSELMEKERGLAARSIGDGIDKMEAHHRENAKKAILRSLSFEDINRGEDSISEAHPGTCEWIFKEEKHGFRSWLENESEGLFWISGKPGSGKSTLVKYLKQDERRHRRLPQQVPVRSAQPESTRQLIEASYFALNSGSHLQKSLDGLLRTMIMQIFDQCPELIALTLANVWRTMLACDDDFILSLPRSWHPWTAWQLIFLWRTLLTSETAPMGMTFFIDGLDECDCDQQEIFGQLNFASSCHDVKVCVSSRPMPNIVQQFSASRTLRMEDFTRDDIAIFVRDNLRQNLVRESDDTKARITSRLVDATQGVIMWVALVLKELEWRILEGPTVRILEQQLENLPTDLGQLYTRMLNKIEHRNKIEAYKMLQLVVHASGGLDLRQLIFANDDKWAERMYPDLVSNDHFGVSNLENSEPQLSAVCGGLVEFKGNQVQFIHRSVNDFLTQRRVALLLEGATAASGFDPYTALLQSNIFLLESHIDQNSSWRPEIKHCVARAIHYALSIEETSSKTPRHDLDQLAYLLNKDFGYGTPQTHEKHSLERKHSIWSRLLHGEARSACFACPESFLTFAITQGLSSYVETRLQPQYIQEQPRVPLLVYATIGTLIHKDTTRPSASMVRTLLSQGQDPNEPFGHSTVWRTLLAYLEPSSQTEASEYSRGPWREICGEFLNHGADRPALRSAILEGVTSETMDDVEISEERTAETMSDTENT